MICDFLHGFSIVAHFCNGSLVLLCFAYSGHYHGACAALTFCTVWGCAMA
jgi:hypothetical protein